MNVINLHIVDLVLSYIETNDELKNSIFFHIDRDRNINKIAKIFNLSPDKFTLGYNLVTFNNEEDAKSSFKKVLPYLTDCIVFSNGKYYVE